jgi:outer membrane lipoprotein LolB
MNVRRALAATLAATLVLAGCAVAPVRPPATLPPAQHAAAMAAQAAREEVLADHRDWHLAGRVALTNDGRGGSGRIEWEQHGDGFSVQLGAPVTRQSWRLSGREGDVLLEGMDGGPRRGTDPTALLREATGWEIPVARLSGWVRGARSGDGPATLGFSADGRLARLVQAGWTLDYADWQAQPDGFVLPMRVTASRGTARVRLVVDAWGETAP